MKGRRSELFHGKCYPTILSLPLHREPYIPVFHFIANLTDHQIQILTEHENAKVSLFLISLLLCTLSLRYWLRLFAFFVPSNQIKSNNTSNRFNFIVTPTSGKDLWPPSQKWNNDSTFRKTKDCRQHVLVTYAKRALKVGSLLVTVRVLKVQRLE